MLAEECFLVWDGALDGKDRLDECFGFLCPLPSKFGDSAGLVTLLPSVTPRVCNLNGLITCLVISFRKAENFIFSFIMFLLASSFLLLISFSSNSPSPDCLFCTGNISSDFAFRKVSISPLFFFKVLFLDGI